jgi:ribosomal protein S18 acetylase RimI-like enzyme
MWDSRATDVGVLTYDGARGRGWGTRLAAAATAFAVNRHGIARYRAQETNLRALAIARRLGYVEYGRHLAIRLG